MKYPLAKKMKLSHGLGAKELQIAAEKLGYNNEKA